MSLRREPAFQRLNPLRRIRRLSAGGAGENNQARQSFDDQCVHDCADHLRYFLIPKQYRLPSNVAMYTRPLATESPLQ
jgi:hypothetical protein